MVNMNNNKDKQSGDMRQFKDDLEAVMERVEEINEKMYDFEANKRNNLIFYGLPNENREVQTALQQKIIHIMKTNMGIRRDIPVAKVRLMVRRLRPHSMSDCRCVGCTQDPRWPAVSQSLSHSR